MPGAKHRLALLALASLLGGCATLPVDPPRVASAALADTGDTRLGRAIARTAAAHPGHTGIRALPDGREAFAARILLVHAADRSVDLQYYIWRDDVTGRLLMEAAAQAAARGVRVRMLLDDANGRKLDAVVADLLAQPNLEIRLFNPFANRSLAVFEALGDFGRLNRRMHNKALIVDNQAAIIGGRNVGDEYFGASETGFADLDVVAVGPLVREVSAEFDRYWNSASAYPALSLMAPTGGLEARRRESEARGGPAAEKYLRALRETPLVRELLAGALPLEWCAARLLADDPAKIHDAGGEKSDLLARIEEALGNPQRELNLVSPYFVPGKEGVNAFARLAARGVRVNVLTNSFAATDVSAVHAGYAKYREDMLRAGVRLFELKPDGKPLPRTQSDDKGYGAPGSQARAGSSGASLHAKTFGVDTSRIFVGSFNLDPRSAHLNTEMGAVIESETLARQLAQAFATTIPEAAYEVRLAAGGSDLQWVERSAGRETVLTTEPHSGAMRRLWVRFLALLPIEWLL